MLCSLRAPRTQRVRISSLGCQMPRIALCAIWTLNWHGLSALGDQIAVLMCDLNGFKAGKRQSWTSSWQQLLQEIAKTCAPYAATTIWSDGLGGDEIRSDSSRVRRSFAKEFQPRLEAAVEQAGEAICGKKLVSASIGTACYPKDGMTAEVCFPKRIAQCMSPRKNTTKTLLSCRDHKAWLCTKVLPVLTKTS